QLNFGTSIQNNRTSSPFSKFSSKKSNFDFQFYVTPSISYRRLIDDHNGELSRSYITALPFAANYVVDINNVVQHKPAAGYELGFSLGYNLNSKFAIRSGLQFNMRQYNISAFVHGFEPAAPSLLTGIAIEPNSITGFRNITESEPIVLKNRYYEISLPVGIDWRLINKKLVWGIAASVQPTYTFDKEPFIVTTNYKNYKDGSQLIRNWNVNVGFETYIGYNTGKYRWQLGPQIRTQLLPSLSSSYPIREYPVDYGIKLSLIRSLK
ncbi:MAG TPA: outer membrane beta-barrel protein, partial [Panacibacter sp.]|nr:outer membrane beta-barrel protein [Panacibacter sp.]